MTEHPMSETDFARLLAAEPGNHKACQAEVNRLRDENESLRAARLRQDGESFLSFLYLRGEVERLRANAEHWMYQAGRLQGEVGRLRVLLNPDNDTVDAIVAAAEPDGRMTRQQVRAILAVLAGGDQ